MSRTASRASLALWHRRERYRQRKLDYYHQRNDKAGIAKWKKLHAQAVKEIRAGEAQAYPLRARAWREMDKLIKAKVTEQGGNNRGKAVEEIIRANGGTPGEPWCGDTVAYCYLKAGAKSVVRSWASVSMLERLLTRVKFQAHVRRGHVVTYTFDHTGLFDQWDPKKGAGWFLAGEGNTGNAGAVSDSQTGGDGVKLKSRHVSQVQGFYRVLR